MLISRRQSRPLAITCRSCGATLSAESRFRSHCGAPQGTVCPACRHDNAPGSRFCSACGAKVASVPPSSQAAPTPPRPAGAARAERRQLTVMFCDLVGSTVLSTRLDPEDLREVIAAYHECVADTVSQFQGYVAQYLGDGALIYFGYPHATENDAERAIRAALAVIAAVAELRPRGQTLAVRVGIASGSVVAGNIVGPIAKPEHGAIGETPNLAARLQALTEPDTVVVAQSTRRLAGGLFDYRDLGRHAFKGFAEPIQAWEVVRAKTDESRSEALRWTHGPMVGRRLELEQLRTVLSACKVDGRGRTAYVRGEAGIGKTRLLEALLAAAREQGFACHTGLVLDFGTGVGRDAIGTLARDLLGLSPNAGEDMVRAAVQQALVSGLAERNDEAFLNDLLQVPQPSVLRAVYDAMDNRTRGEGRRRTMARLVEHSSRLQPRVLAVEDLHWADAVTLTHLAALASVVANCPAVLVMTSRFEQDPLDQSWRAEAGASPLITIDLGPLQPEEAAILAAPFLARSEDAAKRCLDRAAGNPLFLEQLLRNAEEGEDSAIPSSVQSLVQARLDRLAAPDKAAFQAASVLGQRFDREALAHLLDEPDFDARRLLASRMVHTLGDELLFAHALIHEAVYDSLLRSRSRELHRRAADWFASRDATLKASHLDRAGDPAAPAAYLAAAQGQRREYRFDAGRRLAERGLALASEQNDRFALRHLLGELHHELGDMPGALAAFENALTVAGSDAERCRAWIGCAQVKRVIDDIEGAFADLARAEGVAVTLGLKAEEAQLRFLRGNLCFPRGDIAGCLREHGRSLELARQVRDASLEAAALGGLGDAEYARGRMLSANARLRSCVDLCRQHDFGRLAVANHAQVAHTMLYLAPQEDALNEALGAAEAAARVGHLRAELNARVAAMFALMVLGRFETCRDMASEVESSDPTPGRAAVRPGTPASPRACSARRRAAGRSRRAAAAGARRRAGDYADVSRSMDSRRARTRRRRP